MIEAYRLHSSRYPAESAIGASTYGGRWNLVGTEVIYAASSPSLALLEYLVYYDDLPNDLLLTQILIPESVSVIEVFPDILVDGWDA